MEEIIVDAIIKNVEVVTKFVNSYLEMHNCEKATITKLDIAIDEIFSNIVNYSYGDEGGKITVRVAYDENESVISITFIDEGIKYNPLNHEDPDISLVGEDDSIGGLGIFITKNLMDDIQYKYDDGKNILLVYKKTARKM